MEPEFLALGFATFGEDDMTAAAAPAAPKTESDYGWLTWLTGLGGLRELIFGPDVRVIGETPAGLPAPTSETPAPKPAAPVVEARVQPDATQPRPTKKPKSEKKAKK